jgi:hypothetical protein
MLQAVVTMVRQKEVLIVVVHQVAAHRMTVAALHLLRAAVLHPIHEVALHLLHVAAIPVEANAVHAHRPQVEVLTVQEVEVAVAVEEDKCIDE